MDILLYTLKSVAVAITEPYLVMYLVVIGLILYRKNRKISLMQKMVIGEKINSPFELTISQIVIGIFAGTIISLILSYLGVVFDQNSGIDLVFLTSILLMFWKPKFICFSYSAAILGFISIASNLLVKYFNNNINGIFNVDIVALMTLVAVLHFVEGILVVIDGKRGAIPIYSTRNDKIVGGFTFQRYWALPIALFIMINNTSIVDFGEMVEMPKWWPLIKMSIPEDILKSAIVTLIPFYGLIGYNSVTFTKSKDKKVLTSGCSIIIYSIALFILAQLASINMFFKVLVLLFAPLAHEVMLYYQRYTETEGKPKYISEDGITVLEVAPESPADIMNIKSGDIILEVNNKRMIEEEDITKIFSEVTSFLWLKLKKENGKIEEVTYNKVKDVKKLGMVLVPREIPSDKYVVNLKQSKFPEIMDKIKSSKDDKDE